MKFKFTYPKILLILYIVIFSILAINPYDRAVWFAENLPVLLIVLALVLTYNRFQFSNTAYSLMSVFLILHTIGGHYTFALVPFDWFTNFFGFERNHYDRIAHFSVGFYAYAMAEFLEKTKAVNKKWVLYIMPIFFIMAIAASYEVIEWWYAVSADPNAGIAVLGSQGDIWDAQKDILMDTLGALTAMVFFWFKGKK
jgi:putative membrane protein